LNLTLIRISVVILSIEEQSQCKSFKSKELWVFSASSIWEMKQHIFSLWNCWSKIPEYVRRQSFLMQLLFGPRVCYNL
jgi:hypothetical protein